MRQFILLLASCFMMLCTTACSDDDKALQETYGYAQFQIVKNETRATTQLDYLAKATKVRVVLAHEGTAISQTLALQRYDDASAEYGMQSDKLQLVAGDYTITGFYLYNTADQEIYSSDGGNDATFTVQPGGLHYHTLAVDAVLRGTATFHLTKRFTGTRAEKTGEYPFNNIAGASFTVQNVFTHESYDINKVKVSIEDTFETVDGQRIETTYGVCDTTVTLPIGTYQVTQYTTYSDRRCRYVLEAAQVKNAETFVVKANKNTEKAQVPVLLSLSSERIKDYIALKAIWEKMDGANWKYLGQALTPGCNWNFDKDMDLWGEQPGVALDDDGRVTVVSLAGFGARGLLPDEIGQLSQLRVLYVGTHDETLGGMTGSDLSSYDTPEFKARVRNSYAELFLDNDARAGMSETMRQWIEQDNQQKPIRMARINPKDVQMGYLTNKITGISRAIRRCTKLQQLFIANSPITSENFFVDISPDSPFYGDESKWEDFISLTDIEIYNCPKLTALPIEMIAHLPELQVLNVACNPGISGAQLKADWEAIIDGNCGDKLQVLYLGFNKLEETPPYEKLKHMTMLRSLDISYNQLHTMHPFGKEVNPVKLYLSNNRLTHIKPAPDGYFSNYLDVEIMDFSFNQLTEVPDIFNAKSVYIMESVVLSHNNITGLENGENHRGINATSIDLSYNPISEFPKALFSTGSPIQSLAMSGCKLEEIPEGSMTGPKSYYMRSLDLSLNSLSSLPDDFYATNMPYMYGIDLSGNQFTEIPSKPLDCYALTVLILRNQRDDKGARTLTKWLTGIYQHPQLTALYLGGNDLRKIDDYISPNIRVFEIKDNPNISIDLSTVCPYIAAGYYQLFYDKTQDIRGCPSLEISE